jgi:hypothetical protein
MPQGVVRWGRVRLGHIAAGLRRIPPAAILLVGGAIVVAYSFPGYMNYDAADQLIQARTRQYTDWHPPMMAKYWHALEKLFHGPLPLLVVQTALFLWGAYHLFRRRLQPQAAALLAVALMWFPPVLAVSGPVWKDAQMVSFLIAGAALLLRDSWRARGAGLVLMFLAAGVRDNAVSAMPPLLLLAVWTWGHRRRIVVCALAFALFVAIAVGATAANKAFTKRGGYAWYQANAIHDIAGMICFTDQMTDEEVRAQLVGVELRVDTDIQRRFCQQYNPRWWIPLSLDANAPFNSTANKAQRLARRAAYFRLLRRDVFAFAEHRWRVTKELIGLGDEVPDEPVCQTFAGSEGQFVRLAITDKLSSFQKLVGSALQKVSTTLLFRPWAYLLVGLALFAYACKQRQGLVIALIGSGFLYELSFAIAAAGAPFRYSNWMIVCVCVATVLVFRERLGAGRRESQT